MSTGIFSCDRIPVSREDQHPDELLGVVARRRAAGLRIRVVRDHLPWTSPPLSHPITRDDSSHQTHAGPRHGDVAIDASRALSPASCIAAKKVLGRALHRAMQEDLIYRKAAYIADGIRVKRNRPRRSHDPRFRNFLVAGWNTLFIDQDQVHFFAPCERIYLHTQFHRCRLPSWTLCK